MIDFLKYAILSKMAYDDRIYLVGYESRFIENTDTDTQVHVLLGVHDNIVVFRGTELNLKDIMTDLKVLKAKTGKGINGGMHKGFKEAYMSIHKDLYKILGQQDKPVTFTGHSLGGALAIAAGSWHGGFKKQVVTFGAPRVFDSIAAQFYDLDNKTFRFENGCDPVPYVPPYHWKFRHVGHTILLTDDGFKHNPNPTMPFLQMIFSRLKTKGDAHDKQNYVNRITNIKEELSECLNF